MVCTKFNAIVWLLFAAFLSSSALAQGSLDYTVETGDQLSVSVYDKPELSGTFRVRADGNITLHLLGDIPAAGATFADIEKRIIAKAAEQFSSRESALVDIVEFRGIFVLGMVQTPGAYQFNPGINVMKAVALAGGFERQAPEASFDREIEAARRRVLQAQSELVFVEAKRSALSAELARLAGQTPIQAQETPDATAAEHHDLIGLRRALSDRFAEGAKRKQSLANDEAELFMKRHDLIETQLKATEEQLANITGLAAKGLVRRDQILDLQVDLGDFRADVLEAAAFEARARQTAANADSEFSVEQMQYRHALLSDKIAADEHAALTRSELEASLEYLRSVSPETAQSLGNDVIETVFEIYKSGEEAPTRASLTTPLGPDDVLIVRFEVLGQ